MKGFPGISIALNSTPVFQAPPARRGQNNVCACFLLQIAGIQYYGKLRIRRDFFSALDAFVGDHDLQKRLAEGAERSGRMMDVNHMVGETS